MADPGAIAAGLVVYLALGLGIGIAHTKNVRAHLKARDHSGAGAGGKWVCEDDFCFCPANFFLAWLLWPLLFLLLAVGLACDSGKGARTVCGIPLMGRRRKTRDAEASREDVESGGGGGVVLEQPPARGQQMREGGGTRTRAEEARRGARGDGPRDGERMVVCDRGTKDASTHEDGPPPYGR